MRILINCRHFRFCLHLYNHLIFVVLYCALSLVEAFIRLNLTVYVTNIAYHFDNSHRIRIKVDRNTGSVYNKHAYTLK